MNVDALAQMDAQLSIVFESNRTIQTVLACSVCARDCTVHETLFHTSDNFRSDDPNNNGVKGYVW